MLELDPEGLAQRSLIKKRKRRANLFRTDGPLYAVLLDGRDKLCQYQDWTFTLGLYGYPMLSNPHIARRYFDFLYDSRILPKFLRIDKGSETGKMATLHAYLTSKLGVMEDPTDFVRYGPSNTNKIERWWHELHGRLEAYFKAQLSLLLKNMEYDPHNSLHRQVLAYIYIPVVQRECNIFINIWNSHRIRYQGMEVQTGIPIHMFEFPEMYGGSFSSNMISKNQLCDSTQASSILQTELEINLEPHVKALCERFLPSPEVVESVNACEAYKFLLAKFT